MQVSFFTKKKLLTRFIKPLLAVPRVSINDKRIPDGTFKLDLTRITFSFLTL